MVVQKLVNIPSQADSSRDADMLTLLKEYIKDKHSKPGNVYLGLVHRLDRPVGGVMIFAKTSKAASRLFDQIQRGEFERIYIAVVRGKVKDKNGHLKDYLVKDTKLNIVRIGGEDDKNAKLAVLDYAVLSYRDNLSLVMINLHTGRSHQIRVQMAAIGHPLFGDQKYGKGLNKTGEQLALWSYSITCVHPTKKEKMTFKSIPPFTYPWEIFKDEMRYG